MFIVQNKILPYLICGQTRWLLANSWQQGFLSSVYFLTADGVILFSVQFYKNQQLLSFGGKAILFKIDVIIVEGNKRKFLYNIQVYVRNLEDCWVEEKRYALNILHHHRQVIVSCDKGN